MYDHVAMRRYFRACLKPTPEITPLQVQHANDGRHHWWSDGTIIVRVHQRSPVYDFLPEGFEWPAEGETVTLRGKGRETTRSMSTPLTDILLGYLRVPAVKLIRTPAVFHQDHRPALRLMLADGGERIWIQERYYRWLGKTEEERRRVQFTLHGDAVIGWHLDTPVLLVMRNLATTAPGYDLWDDLSDLMLMKRGMYTLFPEPEDDDQPEPADMLVHEMVVTA